MKKYEIFANNGRICLVEGSNGKETMYVGNKALEVFNQILNQEVYKLDVKEDENNRYMTSKDLEIDLIDYRKLMRIAQELKKKEKKKKKILVSGATAATAGIMALAAMIGAKGKTEAATYDAFESKPIEFNVDEDIVSEEEKTQDILTAELDNNMEEAYNDFVYSDETLVAAAYETIVYLDVDPRYDEGLERNVREYDAMINEISAKWGVSNMLIRDIMKQESSGGKRANKMQIVFSAWEDQIIKVYNFQTQRYETLVLTNNPSNYPNVTYVVTKNQLDDPYTNINVGTMILEYLYGKCSHNIITTTQAFNFGTGATNQVLREEARVEGLSFEDIIGDETNVNFINYTYVKPASYGDHEYVYHVFSTSSQDFNLDEGKEYTMRYLDEDGNICEKTTIIRSSRTMMHTM